MKKLLFVAMLGIAGLMSAKGNTNQVKEEEMPKKNVKNKNASNQLKQVAFLLHCPVGFREQPAAIIQQNFCC